MSAGDNSNVAEYCRIEGPASPRMLEFQSFNFPLTAIAAIGLPASPRAVQRDGSGRATLLHFAPGRFLLPWPAADLVRAFDGLQAAGVGSVFDVDGKWQAFELMGPGAERVLSSTIDLARVLSHSDCAALHLFDCPAVLARRPGAFEVWVEASYASAFRERAGHLATLLER